MQANEDRRTPITTTLLALIVMSSGRAMTLGWIGRAGDGGDGDPPAAWLMPLIGDAAIGLSALVVAWLVWTRPSPTTWAIAIAWSSVAAFDALAAYIVDTQTPWPEFFMLELFGRSMFFMAIVLHVVIIALLVTERSKTRHGVSLPAAR